MSKSKMTPEEKQEYLETISFSNLVKAIDEKWSHTYIDPPEVEESDIEALLQTLEEQ
jgi:hypothetical protein